MDKQGKWGKGADDNVKPFQTRMDGWMGQCGHLSSVFTQCCLILNINMSPTIQRQTKKALF